MRTQVFLLLVAVLVAGACIAGCSAPGVPSAAPAVTRADQTASSAAPSPVLPDTLSLQIDSLAPGSTLPADYTCTGASESPEVSWKGIPAGTKSLVLVLDDPDAPAGTFTHWLVYNIPPEAGSIPRARSGQKVLEDGAQQGDNSAGSRGYYPPCPPVGSGHRYIFRLYAVDTVIAQPTADRGSIDTALYGHTLAKTTFLTRFER